MFRRFTFVCLSILTFSEVSLAGEAIKESVICPVGGETFTITGTLSCSTLGRTMSFRPFTSCDFVTRLPVCPSNGLPIYQAFSDQQLAALNQLMESGKYEVFMELPPWQRAYALAQHLGQSETETAFNLLLSAMWFESAEFFGNATTIDLFLHEADAELLRAHEESKPYINAILAYVLSVEGRLDEADKRLESAKSEKADEYLLKYVSAIEACQNDMAREGCQPNDFFER